jgi:hypothetical protein
MKHYANLQTVEMDELNPLKWQEIFAQLVEEGHYDVSF